MGRASTANLLQEMHEGTAVRQLLHQRQREVQAAAGMRMLSYLTAAPRSFPERERFPNGTGMLDWDELKEV